MMRSPIRGDGLRFHSSEIFARNFTTASWRQHVILLARFAHEHVSLGILAGEAGGEGGGGGGRGAAPENLGQGATPNRYVCLCVHRCVCSYPCSSACARFCENRLCRLIFPFTNVQACRLGHCSLVERNCFQVLDSRFASVVAVGFSGPQGSESNKVCVCACV
jgi:hypothetical protein